MRLHVLAKKMLPAEFIRREVPDSQAERGDLSALLRPAQVERRIEDPVASPEATGRSSHRMTVLVTGASGFVGSRLVKRLLSEGGYSVRCLSRRPESLGWVLGEGAEVVKGDAGDPGSLLEALKGVEVAFYLIHSMEGPPSEWEKFPERDRIYARNFARASSACGVKRIIYLGGLSHGEKEDLSRHMRSREEVGEILRTLTAKVTTFRAAVILGAGSASFEMMAQLVDRLPLMVCPRWVTKRLQPIAVDDVVSYLARALGAEWTVGGTFDIAGPDVLTYRGMMDIYARRVGNRFHTLMLPFLTLTLSSYWVDLVTDTKASLAYPLIESLSKDAVAGEESIRDIIPLKPMTIQAAIQTAVGERAVKKGHGFAYGALVAMSLVMFVLGATFYSWHALGLATLASGLLILPLLVVAALAVYFTREGTRLGALLVGIAGWASLALWVADSYVAVFMKPGMVTSIPLARDIVGSALSLVAIPVSHMIFHKERD